MIERNISLASTGSARTSGCDNQLRLGYSRNRGIYRLNITQTGEWEGMTIRALWHTERGMLFSSLVEDGKIEVPAIVTSTPGCGRLVFEGSDGTRTLTSADIKYSVAMNSGTMGDIPEPPVPAWQQLVALVEQAKDEAWQAGEDARQSAAKANEAYENTIGAKDSAVTEIRKAETDALNNVEASAGPAASAAADAAAAGAKEKTEKAIQEVKDSAVKEVKDAAAGAAARAAQSATDAASSAAEAKKTAQDIQGYYDGVQDLVTDTLRDYTGGYYRSYDLTIPAAGWKEMAKSVGRYWYSCDVAIEGCDSSYVPMGTLTLDTAGEVEKANLATVLQTVEGGGLERDGQVRRTVLVQLRRGHRGVRQLLRPDGDPDAGHGRRGRKSKPCNCASDRGGRCAVLRCHPPEGEHPCLCNAVCKGNGIDAAGFR